MCFQHQKVAFCLIIKIEGANYWYHAIIWMLVLQLSNERSFTIFHRFMLKVLEKKFQELHMESEQAKQSDLLVVVAVAAATAALPLQSSSLSFLFLLQP